MKKYTLLGHVFELDDHAILFLERYVDRIEKYAETHKISLDVLDDIKYGIVEKLYRFETPITEKNVMEVANQLWEPEDIFDGSVESTNEASDEQKKWRKLRNLFEKERPVVWWVCYWISKTTTIPVAIVRITFLVLIFVYGISIWFYPILALFVPYKDKNKTTGRIGNLFFEIIRVILRIAVIWWLGMTLLGAMVALWFLVFTPAINNQTIGARIPWYMYVTGFFATLALLILFIWSIGALFKRRRVTRSWALLSTIVLIVAGVFSIGTIYRQAVIFQDTPSTTVTRTYTFSGDHIVSWWINKDIEQIQLSWNSTINTWLLTIRVAGDRSDTTNISRIFYRNSEFDDSYAHVEILPSNWSTIEIKEEITIKAPTEKDITREKTILTKLDVQQNDNNVSILIPRKLFTETVPFAFAQREITIYVPQKQNFSIDSQGVRRRWDIDNLYSDTQVKIENGTKYIGYCDHDTTYAYDATRNTYICNDIKRNKGQPVIKNNNDEDEDEYEIDPESLRD